MYGCPYLLWMNKTVVITRYISIHTCACMEVNCWHRSRPIELKK